MLRLRVAVALWLRCGCTLWMCRCVTNKHVHYARSGSGARSMEQVDALLSAIGGDRAAKVKGKGHGS